jgi:hypothetical protein
MTTPIGTQLREYTEFFDSQLSELTVDDIINERVTLGAVRPLRMRGQRTGRNWLVAVSAAATIAVLIGGAALLLQALGDDNPPATTLPPVDPSILRGSGTLESPLGALRWSHLTDIEAPVPGAFFPIETASGFAATEQSRDPLSNELTVTYWASSDGLAWYQADLPVPVDAEDVGTAVIDNTFWLWTFSPATLWRSSDFETWERMDLSGLDAPASVGLDWVSVLSRPTAFGSGVAITLRAYPVLPLDAMFPEESEIYDELAIDCGAAEVAASCQVSGRLDTTYKPFASVNFDATPDHGLVLDAETGAILHQIAIEGVGGVTIDKTVFGPNVDYQSHRLGVIDSSGDVSVRSLPPVDTNSGEPTVLGLRDQLFVFTPFSFADDRHGMNVWSSPDGYEWVALGAPTFLADGNDGAVNVFERDGRIFADVFPPDDGERWVSDDGVGWERITVPEGTAATSVDRFGDGFIAWADNGSSLATVWMSVDGTTWEGVDVTDLGISTEPFSGDGGAGGVIVGGKVFWILTADDPGGIDQMWVLEFES